MLIITRKAGERLVIGEDVFFTVLEIKGNQVRLGIIAPGDVPIHREEIFLKVKAEQQVLKAQGRRVSMMDAFRGRRKPVITARQLSR